jgi:signal transduction histidine kinase
LLLIGALVALLTLLAVLQYQWLGQISIAERQTMQTNLRNQARGFQEEFNQEIDRPGSRLRISGDGFRLHAWGDELIERFARWRATATYPGLIKSVFLASVDRGGQFDLMQLDESAKRLDPTDWPASFAGIRNRFAPVRRSSGSETERREMERKQEERSIGSLIEHGYVVEDIPAVVRFGVELAKVEEPRNPAERERMTTEMLDTLRQSPLIIIVLDFDYIRQVFIPALFKRRFTVDGALDYDLAIVYGKAVEGKNEKVARESAETFSPAGDATFNLFNMGASSAEFTHGARWQVVINHRAGSLDAAVAQARRRNLIVSFGILFLLALSVIFIIIITRRAQRLARKQMDFVAGVSHEFRTPLAVIHAVSENLADGLITDQQQIEQCGVVIRNDVRRLAAMVEQVLEFAGASRGKTLYQPQPVDVKELIDHALAANPILEAHQDWHVEKEIESDLPSVLADPLALASAVRNIIDNAVKFGGARHSIRIKARAQTIDHATRVEITIADKGIGIPESDLPHIFEPFYRGREVVAAQVHGNGLGLSLVKNIVDAHDGTITVSSVPGEGTTFSLNLPAANGERPANKRD